ncbi:Hypothetical protein CINCED_3A006754 [Cinara cedri]|uniref:Uncharacterized protein n=1 Tax=Cinara cedri TaxID=506608 RepID=A0A5E4NLJ0_9HEMI|nr:Hypothetical protein CINCED_3A006754 [Cinara cedri]
MLNGREFMVNKEDKSILFCNEVLGLDDTLYMTNKPLMKDRINNYPGTSGTSKHMDLFRFYKTVKNKRKT